MAETTEKKRRIEVIEVTKKSTRKRQNDEKPRVVWNGRAPWTLIKPLNMLMLVCSFLDWKEHAMFAQTCKTFLLASQNVTSYHSHRGEFIWGRKQKFNKKTLVKLGATNIRPKTVRLDIPRGALLKIEPLHFASLRNLQPETLSLCTYEYTKMKTKTCRILDCLSFSNLTELDISAVHFQTKGSLSRICPKLHSLTLCLVNRCDLSELAGLPLVKLLLKDNELGNRFHGHYNAIEVDIITRLIPSLETLQGNFTLLAIRELGRNSSLTDLTLMHNCQDYLDPFVNGADLFKTWTSKMRLKRLKIEIDLYHYQQILDLSRLALVELKITTKCFERKDCRRDMDCLRAYTTLTSLSICFDPCDIYDGVALTNDYINWSGLSALANLTYLELVSTSDRQYNLLKGSVLLHLTQLQNLQELKLVNCILEPQTLDYFPALGISRLTIQELYADQDIIHRIAEMKQLQELDISTSCYCTTLSNTFARAWSYTWVRPLLSCPTLHTLICDDAMTSELAQECRTKFRKFKYFNQPTAEQKANMHIPADAPIPGEHDGIIWEDTVCEAFQIQSPLAR